MNQNHLFRISLTTRLALCFFLFSFSACAGHKSFERAEEALKNKNWDVAVAEYSRALAEDPNNAEIKLKFDMVKIFASRFHYEEAKRMTDAKKMQEAVMQLEIAADLDPENKEVQKDLEAIKQKIQHPEMNEVEPKPAAHPLSELPSVALEPDFRPKTDAPIELKFKDTSLKEVLQTLGKLGDVNILFDKDFKDMPVSFDFNDTTFIQSMDTVLTSSHNFYKVIGKNTVMISPDTPEKRSEYEESVSRTFFLSNAEVEEIARTLRNVLGIQMISTNVRLNTVTIKDKITKVIAAEKIVNQLDKAKPEVVVDVEILEINRDRMQNYGLHVASSGSEGISTTLSTQPDKLTLDPGPIVSRSNFFITNFPQVTLNLLKQSSDSRLLASLPLRSVVGETGRVRFGAQVPVPQTTFAPIATGGVNQQPITSFIYRDIGINIDITPRVHRDGDVTLEVIIESSAIAGTGFATLPQFSTSRVEKTIRLKQGETNIIAGLIRDEERTSLSGLPGLASIPILGKLFANNQKEIKETDVVIALSPHIVRTLDVTSDDEKMLWLGIEEQNSGASGFRPYSPVPPAYEEPAVEEKHPSKQQPEEIQNDENNSEMNSDDTTSDDTEETPPQ